MQEPENFPAKAAVTRIGDLTNNNSRKILMYSSAEHLGGKTSSTPTNSTRLGGQNGRPDSDYLNQDDEDGSVECQMEHSQVSVPRSQLINARPVSGYSEDENSMRTVIVCFNDGINPAWLHFGFINFSCRRSIPVDNRFWLN